MLGGSANLKSPTLRIPPASAGGGCQTVYSLHKRYSPLHEK